MASYVGAIDQGTTSTRFIVFDRSGRIVGQAQKEHAQICPKPGWVEHDPEEIWRRVLEVVDAALAACGLGAADLAAIGIANQRETTIVWDRRTGRPICNAIVWQDTRVAAAVAALAADGGQDRYRERTGLPLSTYFSGLKIRWILDSVGGARAAAEAGELAFGTVDSWLVWRLTGGTKGGAHVTDVTNASRTQLMNLATLDWDETILADFRIPRAMLPRIRSSAQVFGTAVVTAAAGAPVAAILGDQQAALFGQACFAPGAAKNTYGTGCFLLMNTGERPARSTCGLLTTVAYRIGEAPAVYALEGSVAVAGALVQWLRDNLGLIATSAEVETLAGGVADSGGAYVVPAFSGLYAPYWKDGARGAIVGLTRYVDRRHLARAALEATAFQVREVVDAMEMDSGVALAELRADGGMAVNDLLMQFQADILARPVVRPAVMQTTALGAASAAGLAVGFFRDTAELAANWAEDRRWRPAMDEAARERRYGFWKKAVTRSFDWVE